MILDLQRFIAEEQPYWGELEAVLKRLETRAEERLTLEESRRFYYLYRRAASDLAQMQGFTAEPAIAQYLESLTARAYAEIHETRDKPYRLRPLTWFFETFPQTFRRHYQAFLVALAVTLGGCSFGAGVLYVSPETKAVLLPFSHLAGRPSERVAEEEQRTKDRMAGRKATFAAQLMQNNIRVSIMAMVLGITWALGTVVLLFFNGVILGVVTLDYVLSGESVFLAGWLLPHGVVEIPAILLAGQSGLVLGNALIGWGSAHRLRERLRLTTPDLVTLIGGVALLLVWAGIIEAFFSQYHGPALYLPKIAFGILEFGLLCAFLLRSGRVPSMESSHA